MIKNLIAVFIIIILLGSGYYVLFTGNAMDLNFTSDVDASAQLLQNTQLFIERQQQLQNINLDTTIFDDQRFRTLNSYELPVPVLPVGKQQLFDPIESSGVSPAVPFSDPNIPNFES